MQSDQALVLGLLFPAGICCPLGQSSEPNAVITSASAGQAETSAAETIGTAGEVVAGFGPIVDAPGSVAEFKGAVFALVTEASCGIQVLFSNAGPIESTKDYNFQLPTSVNNL